MYGSNWYGATGQAVVINPMKKIIYNLGCGIHVNLGQVIFDRIVEMATGDKKFRLYYHNLIYQMMVDQGYVPTDEEKRRLVKSNIVKEEKSFVKTKSAKGRVIDLPYQGLENAEEFIPFTPYVAEPKNNNGENDKEKKKGVKGKHASDSDTIKKKHMHNYMEGYDKLHLHHITPPFGCDESV